MGVVGDFVGELSEIGGSRALYIIILPRPCSEFPFAALHYPQPNSLFIIDTKPNHRVPAARLRHYVFPLWPRENIFKIPQIIHTIPF